MDLRTALLRMAAARPHVLVIGGPGIERLRARVAHEALKRRWPVAAAPADADIVVVVGTPGRELASVVDDVWAGVPAPRARVRITHEDEVPGVLDGAVKALRDGAGQRAEAPGSSPSALRAATSPDGHEGHDVGHHHHGGGMELPGGLAMADLGEDRDGLALDRPHLTLGPVLPEWPSGLVVEVTIQGDVIQEAHSRFLDVDDGDAGEQLPPAARALTSAARVLALAGWTSAAAHARDLRDSVLFGEDDTARVLDELNTLRRRVRRSRVLRWMLRSPGAGRSEILQELEDKLLSANAALTEGGGEATVADDLAALDTRLVGAEFATARLIIASADPVPQPTTRRATTRGGES